MGAADVVAATVVVGTAVVVGVAVVVGAAAVVVGAAVVAVGATVVAGAAVVAAGAAGPASSEPQAAARRLIARRDAIRRRKFLDLYTMIRRSARTNQGRFALSGCIRVVNIVKWAPWSKTGGHPPRKQSAFGVHCSRWLLRIQFGRNSSDHLN